MPPSNWRKASTASCAVAVTFNARYCVFIRPAAEFSLNSSSPDTSSRSSCAISSRISELCSSERSASKSAAASGSISSTISAARSESRLDDGFLYLGIDFLQRLGGNALIESFKDGFTFVGSQLFDNVGDVSRMQPGQAIVGDLQFHPPRRIGFNHIHKLPGDDAFRNLAEQGS